MSKIDKLNRTQSISYADRSRYLNGDLSIQWIKDSFGYDTDTLSRTFQGRMKFLGNLNSGNYSLTIENIRLEDDGEYACQAMIQTHGGKFNHSKVIPANVELENHISMSLIKSETAKLTVIVLPSFIELYAITNNNESRLLASTKNSNRSHEKSIWLRIGHDVTLHCRTGPARPSPTLDWSVNHCSLTRSTNPITSCPESLLAEIKDHVTFQIFEPNLNSIAGLDIDPVHNVGNHSELFQSHATMQLRPTGEPFTRLRVGCHVTDWQKLTNQMHDRRSADSDDRSIYTNVGLHYIGDVSIEPMTVGVHATLIEFHPIRFECIVGRLEPEDSRLVYKWSMKHENQIFGLVRNDSLNEMKSFGDALRFTLQEDARKNSRIELLPTREMHGKSLVCTVYSQVAGTEPEQELNSSAYYVLDVLYGPQILSPAVEYVATQMKQWTFPLNEQSPQYSLNRTGSRETQVQFLSLSCETDSNPPAMVRWYFGTGNNHSLDKGQHIRVPLTREWHPRSLNDCLASVPDFREDSRWLNSVEPCLWNITCEATVLGFSSRKAVKRVARADKPVISCPDQIHSSLGDHVNFSCVVLGLPIPSKTLIVWQFIRAPPHKPSSGQRMITARAIDQNNQQDAPRISYTRIPLGWITTLQIDHLRTRNFGLYNCSGRNSMGTSWKMVLLSPMERLTHTGSSTECILHIFLATLLFVFSAVLFTFAWKNRKTFCNIMASMRSAKVDNKRKCRNKFKRRLFRTGHPSTTPKIIYPIQDDNFHVINNQLFLYDEFVLKGSPTIDSPSGFMPSRKKSKGEYGQPCSQCCKGDILGEILSSDGSPKHLSPQKVNSVDVELNEISSENVRPEKQATVHCATPILHAFPENVPENCTPPHESLIPYLSFIEQNKYIL